MPVKKRTYIGDQEGLKLAEDDVPISKEEALFRLKEMERCCNDLEYFAEHYYTIIDENGDKKIIKLFDKQRQLLNLINDNNRVCVCASRQVGKSETYSIFCTQKICFKKNYRILISGNKGEIAREILKKIKDAYELLPNWMKPSIKVWNESKIVFSNGCTIKASTTAKNSARGWTCDVVVLDEFSFVLPSTQDLFFTSVIPTISSRPGSKVIVVSTPNGVGDRFHKIWTEATNDPTSVWKACRIDWWERPGRDEAWYKRELATLGSQEKFDQEYGNSFTQTAGNKLIPDDKILELQKKLRGCGALKTMRFCEPSNPNCKYSYVEYFPYEKGRTYIASADVAEGTGRDSSVLYIFDITDGRHIKLCAMFSSSKVIPSDFAYVVYHMLLRYNSPKLLIEANSIGVAVIDALVKPRGFKYPNVIEFNKKNGEKGIFSHIQTKSRACLNVQRLVQSGDYDFVLPDEELMTQMTTFVRQSTSQHIVYKASGENHDDHVLAFIWGMFVFYPEILKRNFNVEYTTNPDTKEQIPILVVNKEEDLDEAKLRKAKGGNPNAPLTKEERFALAAKWKMLGDDQRAEFILSSIWQEEFDRTGGVWGNNPYQLDPRKFSEGFFGDRYKGQGRDYTEPLDESDDDDWESEDPSDGYGFCM